MSKTFLSAEWRNLIMANYAVDPKILEKYLPKHTELDLFNGVCYVSLVGFMFLNTRLKGIAIPLHSNFEEVNLRFYVKHKDTDGNYKRGVVFINEIVPKPALSLVANLIYHEPYVTMPMTHNWTVINDALKVSYSWRKNKKWYSIQVVADNTPTEITLNSEEEFITEHYWGYTKINDAKTSEYSVEHPRWLVHKMRSYDINVDFKDVYGTDFEFLNQLKPLSVLLADGSEIAVNSKNILV
jgi:uncharacterized protein